MAEKKKSGIAARVAELVKDAVEECGVSLWDVEFVKEGPDHNLVIYIDRPEGVSLTDCEMVNDAVEPIIDEADPIEGSYTLEVGSAGAERVLKRPADFQRYLNSPVLVKLYKPVDGRKEFPGTLTAYNEADGSLTVDLNGTAYTFGKKDVALCRLRVEF